MRKTKFLSIVIIALVVINAGTLAYLFLVQKDNHQHPPHKMGKGGVIEYIFEKLQFDDEQQANFKELRKEHHHKMKSIHGQLEKTRNKYFDGLKTNTIDTAESRRLQNEVGKLLGQLHGATFEHFTQVRQLCRPEQQKLFDGFINDILRAMAPPAPGDKRGHHPPPRH